MLCLLRTATQRRFLRWLYLLWSAVTMKPKLNHKPGPIDNCQTPGYALDPIEALVDKSWFVWEPAIGEGYLVAELLKRHYKVIAPHEDFFSYQPSLHWDIIITNPPYSLKYDWIERCYELGKPWLLLLPVETLGSGKAQKMFRENGINVILLSKRINFKMPNKGWTGSAQFPVAWFWWRGVDTNEIYYYDYRYLTKEVRQSYER